MCAFGNMKVKAYIGTKAHILKALYPEPAHRFSRNLEKFGKFQG